MENEERMAYTWEVTQVCDSRDVPQVMGEWTRQGTKEIWFGWNTVVKCAGFGVRDQ